MAASIRDHVMCFSKIFVLHPEAFESVRPYIAKNLTSYVGAGMIGEDTPNRYFTFMNVELPEQRALLAGSDGREIVRALFEIIDKINDDNMLTTSILCTLDGLVFDELSNVELLVKTLKHPKKPVDIITTCLRLIQDDDVKIVEGACLVLASFLAKVLIGPAQADYLDPLERLLNFLVGLDNSINRDAVVYCLLNLFKVERARESWVKKGGVRDILAPVLRDRSGSPQVIYATICCLWQISFDRSNMWLFEKQDLELVKNVINELRKAEKEKILRVSLALLKNLCEESNATVEIMVENKLLREIDAIAKRVIKDEDVKAYIEQVATIMEQSIKILSSYEKYISELQNGNLVPGVTHTEAFWKENVRHFEENRFENIAKIAALLQSTDETCQVLACFDLGEFARLHPFGKTILDQFNVKTLMMQMMSSPNKRLAEAALLCIQKIMVHNWQGLSS